MFQRFYPDEAASEGERFAERALAAHAEISAAQVQGHFLLHKMDPAGSIDNVAQIRQWGPAGLNKENHQEDLLLMFLV